MANNTSSQKVELQRIFRRLTPQSKILKQSVQKYKGTHLIELINNIFISARV